jgi:hypothetical protein
MWLPIPRFCPITNAVNSCNCDKVNKRPRRRHRYRNTISSNSHTMLEIKLLLAQKWHSSSAHNSCHNHTLHSLSPLGHNRLPYYNVHSQLAPPNSYLPFPPSHAQQQQQQQYFGMMMPPPPLPSSSNYAFPPAIMMHPMAPFPPNSDYRPDNRQFEQHPHPQPPNMPPSFDRAERPHGNHSLTIEPRSSSAQATMVTPPLHTQHVMDNSPYSRPPPQQRLPPYRRVSGQSADVGDQFLTSSSYDSSDCVDFPQTASQGIVMSGRNSKGAAPPPPPPPPPPLPPPETPHPSSLLIRQDSLGSVSSLGSLDRSGRDNASRTNASFFDRFNPWASPPKEPNVTDFHRKNQAFLTKMERIQGLSSPSPLQMAKR